MLRVIRMDCNTVSFTFKLKVFNHVSNTLFECSVWHNVDNRAKLLAAKIISLTYYCSCSSENLRTCRYFDSKLLSDCFCIKTYNITVDRAAAWEDTFAKFVSSFFTFRIVTALFAELCDKLIKFLFWNKCCLLTKADQSVIKTTSCDDLTACFCDIYISVNDNLHIALAYTK